MSVSKSRAGFKRRSSLLRREEQISRTLTYNDSDDGSSHDEAIGSSPMCSPDGKKSYENTYKFDEGSSEFFELEIPDCSIISSPKSSGRLMRRKRFSPLNFGLEEVEEEAQKVPGSDSLSPSSDFSPPHRKLRALRLFDTPHTPKSLLERARRRRPTGDKPRIAVDRPQANVNPFTPSPHTEQNDSGYIGSGKRSRTDLER